MFIRSKFFSYLLWLQKPSNTLWVYPTIGAIFATIFSLLGLLANEYPFKIAAVLAVDESTLNGLLDIIASSMLAVSTFSLSIMVSAFASASSNVTPRATELVMSDDNTRIAIASFISAFIYAIIAKIALGLGYYADSGRLVLFISTVIILIYLIYTLINWVKTLSQLGRLDHTLLKIQKAAKESLLSYRRLPAYGTRRIEQASFPYMVKSDNTGYLTHINFEQLQNMAQANECEIEIVVHPGKFIHAGMVIAYLEYPIEAMIDKIKKEFFIQGSRIYKQDPRFGLLVLSEVAQRALSPAVNDPGTAIKVLTIFSELFVDFSEQDEEEQIIYDRLSIIPFPINELINQPLSTISRDGASILEIHIKMQKILKVIAEHAPEQAIRTEAIKQAKLDLDYAINGLALAHEKSLISELYQQLFGKH